MSLTALIIGESGAGKSTSIRHLDSHSTFIINVIDKPLPFKSYKKHYKSVSKDWKTGNYVSTDDADQIQKAISFVDQKRPDIKTIILDDFQYVMANEFMRKATERGYEKFTKIAQNAWSIISRLSRCRLDLDSFVLSHSEIDAVGRSKCKTIGKMLDDKITIEGMFTIVLHSVVSDGRYGFFTQHNGAYLAKSPEGMFKEKFINNDLSLVKDKIHEYLDEDIDDEINIEQSANDDNSEGERNEIHSIQ